MDKIDELVIDVALEYNGRKDYYAGRNLAKEFEEIAQAEEKVIKKNEKLAKSQEKVATSGFKLGQALRTLGLYIGIREVIKYADEWQKVSNVLSQITENDKERITLQEKLYKIGRRTRISTSETADLYTSLSAVGLSKQQQLNATETLQKAFKSTGSNQRAVESIKRMLKTGKLTSLLGINQSLAEVIASGMNISLTELQQKIRKGGLTSMQVLTALSNKSKDIDKNFSKTKTTLSDAFNSIRESFMHLLGNLEDSTGIFTKMAKAIEWLGDNLKHLAMIIGVIFTKKLIEMGRVLLENRGAIGTLKNAFQMLLSGEIINGIKALTSVGWKMVAPWVRLLAVFELVDQAIKMLKGEWNWYAEAIDKIERGTWWLANKVTGQNKPFQGTFSSDVKPMTPARTITNTYGGSQNITQNQNFNVTINEARDGSIAYDRLTQTLRQANAGIGGVR